MSLPSYGIQDISSQSTPSRLINPIPYNMVKSTNSCSHHINQLFKNTPLEALSYDRLPGPGTPTVFQSNPR